MALTGAAVLTDLATLKAALGITGSSEDTRLEGLIRAATAQIEAWCRVGLTRQTVTNELHQTQGGVEYVLGRVPVVSVTSIVIDSSTVPSSQIVIANANAGVIRIDDAYSPTAPYVGQISQDPVLRWAEYSTAITYVAGWITAQQETDGVGTRNLPYDLEEACLRQAAYLRRSFQSDGPVSSERLGDASISYAIDAMAVSGGVCAAASQLLTPYRRLGVG